MNNNLSFIFSGETLSFRALRRKGELRWITSCIPGTMGAMTKFASPTKLLPRVLLSLLSLIDYKLPKVLNKSLSINISKEFVERVSKILNIPIERIGIYIGEPNQQQKILITDVKGSAKFILKVAVGSKANKSLEKELEGSKLAKDNINWQGKTAEIIEAPNVINHRAILIKKTEGRQLSPSEFKREYVNYSFDIKHDNAVILKDWFHENYRFETTKRKSLLEICEKTGVLDLKSQLGFIHGDFAPWNTIKSSDNIVFIDLEHSRDNAPLIIDIAYAVWCYEILLNNRVDSFMSKEVNQLVALGALWEELRKNG